MAFFNSDVNHLKVYSTKPDLIAYIYVKYPYFCLLH